MLPISDDNRSRRSVPVVTFGLIVLNVVPMSAFAVLGLWFVLQLFSGIASITTATQAGGVAYMAHVGGFVSGLCSRREQTVGCVSHGQKQL